MVPSFLYFYNICILHYLKTIIQEMLCYSVYVSQAFVNKCTSNKVCDYKLTIKMHELLFSVKPIKRKSVEKWQLMRNFILFQRSNNT